MYRPEIKVLDCTIRDGGLINKWQFSDELVRATYKAVCDAGVDYMEIGYKASPEFFDPKEFGKWRFCKEEDVREVLDGLELKSKLACMVDIGRVKEEEILPADQSVFDLFRVACYIKDVDKGIALANHIMDKGYEVTLNLMAVSTNLEKDIDEGLAQINNTEIPCVYLVDSFGNMYSEDITFLAKKYSHALPGKTIGIHCHNNRQLAFANTIQAIIEGSNMLDASVYGIGRGAGNCTLELLIGFLKNPKYNLRPVLKLIEDHFVSLRNQIEWGYIIPMMITGTLNEHPRSAMEWRAGPQKDNYVEFYDKLTMPEIVE
ncbi:aldolase catalytic domain-containing protein [Candidatus Parabeggiatoa sp. HSG14]|uniref:aldolase catalytic domain-containing protein n=1 Tax=Candidatus Parabeggiatoa sp. HSG14 TaxID=3055593 RepID=UPI0025A86E68|nr:aldolase catalytic domain-containing protein [Thiotrichales bacterium HSG14]